MNNLLRLKGANPKVKMLFDKVIEYANNAGYDVTVTGCYYDYDKGVELHAQDSRNPVFSYHTFGLAMDVNLKNRSTGEVLQKASSSALWLASGVPQYAKLIGLRWGGEFKTYYDPIHFDYASYTIDQLKQIAFDQRKYDTSNLNTLNLV